MPGFYNELKRRNVVRSGIAYVVIGWLAIQVAELVLPTFGTPDWVLKTLIFLVVLGFPFVLVFAWAFEITPDGVKKTADVDLDDSITMSTGRKIDFVIIAGLVVALGYFMWDGRDDQTSEPTEPISRSIAVLPFDDMSPNGDQQWFADGLAEEILNALARTPDLLVSARNSSFAFRDTGDDLQAIAAKLGVDHILEGSIRRGVDRLRVTAQLIRASDGFHLWSQNYDRTPDDMIAIQEDVAIEIARALQTAMDPEALASMMASGTSNVPAYEAYLRALSVGLEQTFEGEMGAYIDAVTLFERAVELDPEFTQAWWQLAYWTGSTLFPATFWYGIFDIPDEQVRIRFDEAIENAIFYEKDPAFQSKYRHFEAMLNGRPGQSSRYLLEYMSAHPNDLEAHYELSNLTFQLRQFEDAQKHLTDRMERFPDDPGAYIVAMDLPRFLQDDELTREAAGAALRQFPDSLGIKYQAHRALLWAGDIDGAARLLPALRNGDWPFIALAEIRQACAENRLDDAIGLVEPIQALEPFNLWMEWFLLQVLGQLDEAAALLQPLEDTGDFMTLYSFMSYPYFDANALPEFAAHVKSEGGLTREPIEMPYRCRFPE